MRSNFITAAHVTGIMNIEADAESRIVETKTDWKLNESYFHITFNDLRISFSVKLFTSWINTQLSRFYLCRQDRNAKVINAFTVNRYANDFYCFPPSSCIGKVIQWIISDKISGILIVSILVCVFNRLACRLSVFHAT